MTAPAILSYGRPRRRLARVPLLFRARDCEDEDGIFALSYGKRVGLVHTRTGANGLATMADESGRLVRVPSDWPRLSWETTTATDRVRALLVEQGAINLCTHPIDLTNASWSKSRATITANAEIAPDGTLTGDRLVEDATTANTHSAGWSFGTIAAGATVTGSAFVKAGPRTWAVVQVNGGGATFATYINLATGALGSSTVTSTGVFTRAHVTRWIAPGGGIWWRVLVTGTLGGAITTAGVAVYIAEANLNPNFDGDGASYIGVWGANLVEGHGSSFIPASGSAVTRAADSAYFPLLLTPREMTLYAGAVNLGGLLNTGASRRLLHLGGQNTGIGPYFSVWGSPADSALSVTLNDGATAVSDFVGGGTPVALRASVEMRAILTDAGDVEVARAIDGAAEVSSTPPADAVLPSAWTDSKLWLAGTTSHTQPMGYLSLVLDFGTQELDELRELVEVA